MRETTAVMINVSERARPAYDRLRKELGNISAREAIFIAAGWGLREGVRAPLGKASGTGARLTDLGKSYHALIAAVHLSETGDAEDLLDYDAGLKLIEEYAEGGFRLLEDEMDAPGDFPFRFAAEIKKIVDEAESLDS